MCCVKHAFSCLDCNVEIDTSFIVFYFQIVYVLWNSHPVISVDKYVHICERIIVYQYCFCTIF